MSIDFEPNPTKSFEDSYKLWIRLPVHDRYIKPFEYILCSAKLPASDSGMMNMKGIKIYKKLPMKILLCPWQTRFFG